MVSGSIMIIKVIRGVIFDQQQVLQYIQIMSVGFPIDVTRLLGDNQRFQRDLSLAHQLQHQLRAQLDQTLAANQALKAECDQLQRQKQGEFNHFIAAHQELYENEISTLRMEREVLIKKIKQHENDKPDPKFEETIQQLNRQIEKHQQEKKAMEKDLTAVKELMLSQQKEIHQKLNQQIRQKQFQIKELESMNVDLKDAEQVLKNEAHRAKIDKVILEENYIELRQQFQRLQANWKAVADKNPVGILTELIQIRNQNISLKKQLNQNNLAAFDNDEDVYGLLKKLHEELAILRYELTESKNASSEIEITFQNERAQFRNQKAQQQLEIIKLQKELSLVKDQDRENKIKLEKLEGKLKGQIEDALLKEKVEEEIALLKIKVFVLESLRNSEKYRRSEDVDYAKFEAQFQAFGAFKLKSSRIDVLKNVASMHVAMTETLERLKQEEIKKREATKKYREYRSKWEALSKSEGESLRALQRFRQKEVEYQKLIERMQAELQKAYTINVEVNEKQNVNILISSYQQKLEIVNRQLLTLQSQYRQSLQGFQHQKRNQEKQINKLSIQIKQIEQNYSQLQLKNRSLESKILEQSLTTATNKSGGKNYQAELAQKTAALIITEQELQTLRQQISNLKQTNQQQTLTITNLEDEISRLNRQLSSPAAFHYEINFLQQKLAYLEGVLGEQRHATHTNNENHIRTLYQQIAQLKTETQETKHEYFDKSDRVHAAESQIQSYRGRLLELEQALRGIANQNEEKSLEIFRLNEQNNLLSKQLDKIEEELDVLRGKAGSMKQIDLIDRNKQLEDETESTRKELAQAIENLNAKSTELEAIRKQCEEYWSDNLKLLVVIKENNVQLKENKFLTEKYDLQVNNRQQQLETKIQSLQNQNQILKNLVEDLRKSMLDRQSAKQHFQSSSKLDIEELKKQLENKQRENFYFQQELNRLLEERMKEKDTFDKEWTKLVNELNDLRLQFNQEQSKRETSKQHIKSETFNDDSRINIFTPKQKGHEEDQNQVNFRAMIANLEAELTQKKQKIQHLQSELSDFKLSLKRSGIYSQEVIELRNQMQTLLQGKFKLEDKIRVLEQENSLLKIRRISEDVEAHPQVFSQQTFGPSIGTNQLIEQLREPEEEPVLSNIGQLKNWSDRYEEVLCLLVISFAEIESLRSVNAELQQRYNHYYSEYTDRLRHIQGSLKIHDSIEVDINLLRDLECGHRHLVELTQIGLKEGTVGLAQLGSFTESITGGKMIESYSVREEDESLTSQEIIHP